MNNEYVGTIFLLLNLKRFKEAYFWVQLRIKFKFRNDLIQKLIRLIYETNFTMAIQYKIILELLLYIG